jgi:hypothetical protein
LELLIFINLCALILHFLCFLDDKAGSAENKNVKDETSSKPTQNVKDETSSKPTPGPAAGFAGANPAAGFAGANPAAGFAGANPFDFSAMSGLLNVSYFLLSCVICILCPVSAVFTDN